MFYYEPADAVQLLVGESQVRGHLHGLDPELGLEAVAAHVDVRRLAAVSGVEEEAVRSISKRRRHGTTMVPMHQRFVKFRRSG